MQITEVLAFLSYRARNKGLEMLSYRVTEENNEQKSENPTLEFQVSDLTIGIVMLSTSGLKTLKTLFLLPSHIIKLDPEALSFLIRFCPVLLLTKYFGFNTFFPSSHFHYSCPPVPLATLPISPFLSQFLVSTRFSNSTFSLLLGLLLGPFNLYFHFSLVLL